MKSSFPLKISLLLSLLFINHSVAAADLVLTNGKIFTAEKNNEFVQSISIANGLVVSVGSNRDTQKDIQPQTKVIDLGGKLVMPGMIDGHLHLLHASVGVIGASMHGTQVVDIPRLQNSVEKWRQQKDKYRGNVLYVVEVDASYWSKADDLNRIFNQGIWKDIPLFLYGSDQHTGWANKQVLKMSGITKAFYDGLPKQKQQNFGVSKDGELDGTMSDSGLDIVLNAIPEPTNAYLQNAAQKGVDYLHSLGITAWMDAAANVLPGRSVYDIVPSDEAVGTLPIYQALQDRGTLNAHVGTLLVLNAGTDPQKIQHYVNIRQRYHDIDGVNVVGVKMFQDGVPMYPAQTAAMLKPYKNTGKYGDRFNEPEGFADLVTAADENGFIVHVHTVGDRAVRDALDAIETARKRRNNANIAHSLTHLQFISPQDIPRFKELNVIASIPFTWIEKGTRNEKFVKPYVSADEYKNMFATRSLLQAGATLSSGSDWPVATPSPWVGIYKGVTRRGEDGVLNEKQSIDRKDVIYAYTINSAKELGMQDYIGSLRAGKSADFIIVDRDVFSVDINSVKQTKVLNTYFKGRLIYSADNNKKS